MKIKKLFSPIATISKWAFAFIIFLFIIWLIILLPFITIMNSDFYGRLIETKTATGVGILEKTEKANITARLVIHKILTDENAIEVSVILVIEGAIAKEIIDGKSSIIAIVRDGNSYEPYGLLHKVKIDKNSIDTEIVSNYLVAVQSERFQLPASPSVWGYPFDDIETRPLIDIKINDLYTNYFRLEIQKAVPGRMLEVSNETIVDITLTRSITEKILIITSSLIFLFLTGILAYGLIVTDEGLSTLEEIVAVGGYLIAAAGFRDLLGLSRIAGTSALEIIVIGIPLLFLTIGVAISFIRGKLKSPKHQNKASKNNQNSKD